MIEPKEVPVPDSDFRGEMIYYVESMDKQGEWDNFMMTVDGASLIIMNQQKDKACAINLHDILSEFKRFLT